MILEFFLFMLVHGWNDLKKQETKTQYNDVIIRKRRFVIGALKSPDLFGSRTTATKFRGCEWANWVMLFTVNSIFPADSTPAVT